MFFNKETIYLVVKLGEFKFSIINIQCARVSMTIVIKTSHLITLHYYDYDITS
jgi:hypothetical protein